MPLSALDCTGTRGPAGRSCWRTFLGKMRGPPAPAMMTSSRVPRPGSILKEQVGVRWALTTLAKGTPRASSCCAACCIVSQSLWGAHDDSDPGLAHARLVISRLASAFKPPASHPGIPGARTEDPPLPSGPFQFKINRHDAASPETFSDPAPPKSPGSSAGGRTISACCVA